MDSQQHTPLDPEQLASHAFAAGLLLVSAAETSALADALQPLLDQHSPMERRDRARAWLVHVLQAFRAYPLAIATNPADLDLADLWRRAGTQGVPADYVPLLRSPHILALTEQLAPWFVRSGFGGMELDLRVQIVRRWLLDVLDQMRTDPVPLATGARRLDAAALLRARAQARARNYRERRAGGHP